MNDDKQVLVPIIQNYQIVGAIFLTLKLCGVIDWSWWWVLSPAWIECVVEILEGVMSAAGASR